MHDDTADRSAAAVQSILAADMRTAEQRAEDAERQFLALMDEAMPVEFEQSAEAETVLRLLTAR